MRFALLGADVDALALGRAVAARAEHELVWAYDLGAAAAAVLRTAPHVQMAEHWEALLSGEVADAVIVARGDDEARADQLRRLVQAGIALVLSHPVHESMLLYFELEMIRQDTGSIMLPFAPARWHPATEALAELAGSAGHSPLGMLEQVVVERTMPQRTRLAVLTRFVRDADVLGMLCGELTKVGAMTPRGEAAGYANLGIQMSGPAGVLVRWSVGPVEAAAGAKIVLVGTQGKAVLDMPDDGLPWTLETRLDGGTGRQTFPDWDAAAAALANLTAALAGADVRPRWFDAARTMELAEAIAQSLRRGRTVELHGETPSEHGTFKGLMAAIGCFLLAGGLVLTVLMAVAAKLPGMAVAGHWPKILLGLLAAFLALQLFRFAFASGES